MEPALDRFRRNLGFGLIAVLFVSFLAGVAIFGRIVGDAIGTAYVGTTPSAEDLPPLPTTPGPVTDTPQTAARTTGNLGNADLPSRPGTGKGR